MISAKGQSSLDSHSQLSSGLWNPAANTSTTSQSEDTVPPPTVSDTYLRDTENSKTGLNENGCKAGGSDPDTNGNDGVNGDESDDVDSTIPEEFAVQIEAILAGQGTSYDASTEATPKLPMYQASFTNAEKHCAALIQDGLTRLKSGGYQNAETVRLLEMMSSVELKYPPARRIGLSGDSGVGAKPFRL